jgi:hypothetical protein
MEKMIESKGDLQKMTKNLTEEEIDSIQRKADWADEKLDSEKEWITRYKGYADEIQGRDVLIRDAKEHFREWAPLFLYTNISTTKSTTEKKVDFILRYKGQEVGHLYYKNSQDIELEVRENADKYFGYKLPLKGNVFPWRSPEAENFRAHFRKYPTRIDGAKKNEEHRYESALLTELLKDTGVDKAVTMIQPILLVKNRFQMPTPLSASDYDNPKYSNQNGGGIDLLCRTKYGSKITINVFELKDNYEDPVGVLKQAVVYAAFIRKLLRTPAAGSEDWWRLFGFSDEHSFDSSLKINVVAALPHAKDERKFAETNIAIRNDVLQLRYFYFDIEGKDDHVKNVETTIK